MAAKKAAKPATDGMSPVDAWFATEKPAAALIMQQLRTVIRGVSPHITEGIKWNAPSFAQGEHFATFNPRAKKGVQLVLHFGAKPRADLAARAEIPDPAGLLDWKSNDRALVTISSMADINAHRGALEAILRQWITYLPE